MVDKKLFFYNPFKSHVLTIIIIIIYFLCVCF